MFARQKKQPKPKISAVIVAAGNGARMGTDCPKQFLTVFDKPIIAYTLQKFCDCDYVDSIVLVTQSDYIPLCRRICTSYGFDKVKVITEGGATRRESVANGLAQLPDDCEYVMIHDGARPLIDADMLEKSVTAAIENGAAAVGVRVKDTIKYSDDGKYITQTVDRSRLWQIQTPQMFEKYNVMARELGLILSGGTDFHGKNKPHISIGVGYGNLRIPYSVLDGIKEYKRNRENI